jgi:hypothetical protein
MDLHNLTYQSGWYTQNPNDGSWKVSATASANVPPVNLVPKTIQDMEVVPELHSPGLIIHVADTYLISQETLENISVSANPHYDYKNNGSITISGSTTIMGQTIPILEVDLSKLSDVAQKRNQLGNFAGVANVVYSHQTETVMGIPKGVIDQINYTLVQEDERPKDKYALWDLGLEADYSIDVLKIETQQGDKVLDKAKLKKFLAGVADRLALLRKDFNMIKSIYYNGNQPTTNTRTIDFYKQAKTEDGDEELADKERKQQVFKQSQIQKVETTPVAQAAAQSNSTQSPSNTSGTSVSGGGGSGMSGAQMNDSYSALGSGMSANSAPTTAYN